MRIRVATVVRPTESEEKVRAAVRALFPDVTLSRTGDRLDGEGRDDRAFLKSLRDQKIRDSARMVLARAANEGVARVELSKQAAAAGRVNFAVERAPLGNLEVEIAPDDLEGWLDAIAPPPRESDRTAARRLEMHTEEKELEEHYADFTGDDWEEVAPGAQDDAAGSGSGDADGDASEPYVGSSDGGASDLGEVPTDPDRAAPDPVKRDEAEDEPRRKARRDAGRDGA